MFKHEMSDLKASLTNLKLGMLSRILSQILSIYFYKKDDGFLQSRKTFSLIKTECKSKNYKKHYLSVLQYFLRNEFSQ